MVVAVGLTLVEPLADADVNVPGVMAIVAASVVSQLSVLPEPEFMLVGAAVKEVIAGAEAASEDEFDCITELQPASPIQANRTSTIRQGFSPEARSARLLSPILQNEPAEPMQSPLAIVEITLATSSSSQSVFREHYRSQGMTLVTTGIVGERKAREGRVTIFCEWKRLVTG